MSSHWYEQTNKEKAFLTVKKELMNIRRDVEKS